MFSLLVLSSYTLVDTTYLYTSFANDDFKVHALFVSCFTRTDDNSISVGTAFFLFLCLSRLGLFFFFFLFHSLRGGEGEK